jgi:hypothetical protein
VVDVSLNSLTGEYPLWLGNLKVLYTVDMHSNNLTGTLPENFGSATAVTRMELNHNRLEGPLPSSIGNMKLMKNLDLSYNRIDGTLPKEFGQLESLVTLELGHNLFSGAPPNFKTLHSLTKLHLNQNTPGFSGPFPSYIFDAGRMGPGGLGDSSTVIELDISRNNLTGTLPSEISHMQQLTTLDISGNRLSGYLPPLPDSLDGAAAVVDFSGLDQEFWCPFPKESAHHASFKHIDCTCMAGHKCPTNNDQVPGSQFPSDTQCEYDCAACGAGSFSNKTFSSQCYDCAIGQEAPCLHLLLARLVNRASLP